MRRSISLFLSFLLVLTFLPVSVRAETALVGVCMPNRTTQRWNQDGEHIKTALEEAGMTVELQYAEDNADLQVAQIEQMLEARCALLIIASVDGDALKPALEKAKAAGVSVIAYDRPILNTQSVDGYVSFDSVAVGKMQGEYLEKRFALASVENPLYIELFAGDPNDPNAHSVYEGAMSVLKPYIDGGTLIVRSGEIAFDNVATLAWDAQAARARMETLVSGEKQPLDMVLCANDNIAIGVADCLLAAGYAPERCPALTGQDCSLQSVKRIISGLQAMSVFKDTRALAGKCAELAKALLAEQPPKADTTCWNGSIDVPSYLCDLALADAESYERVLIESGYYTAEELSE